MAKKSKPRKSSGTAGSGAGAMGSGGKRDQAVATTTPVVTLEALQNESDSDDDAWPPETKWNADAKALKKAIETGAFESILEKAQHDDDNFEEADLDDDEDDEIDVDDEDDEIEDNQEDAELDQDEGDEVEEDDEEEEENEVENEEGDAEDDDVEDDDVEDDEEEDDTPQFAPSRKNSTPMAEEDDEEPDENDADPEEDSESDDETNHPGTGNTLQNTKRALQVVVGSMVAEKAQWPWSETFSVVTSTPLPFDTPSNDPNTDETLPPTSIHDDLQREVTFYDVALEAVEQAKVHCRESDIVFSRPDDFLAEMVKTDEHMAKVKDRLIFESKKMEAVAQRKANKEQKLRSKESHSNKLAEKAKKKRDHFQAVEAWAESAQANRGRGLADRDDGNSFFQSPGKKRARADEKFGHGGKRGRFKQNDPKELNDMSGYNRRGNFGGLGTKKSSASKSKTGAGANRKGKRARDASRSR